jgi:hypothetical protein
LSFAEPSTSTVDAIKQVHPKRLISRMEVRDYFFKMLIWHELDFTNFASN